MKDICDIVIVGGGFSGLMVAANAVRSSRRRLRIAWADETGRFARGTAYGTAEKAHLLNVPAARMGAWAESQGDFSRWLASRYPAYGTHSFAPRMIYGEYLDGIAAEMRSRADVRTFTAAGSARFDGKFFLVDFPGRRTVEAAGLVLATGNPPCRNPGWPAGDLFIPDFWSWRLSGGKFTIAATEADMPVVIAGAGLSAVDAVMSLRSDGYAGKILAVSPHGHWPQPHDAPAQTRDFSHFVDDLRRDPSVLSYFGTFRQYLADAPAEWRALVDSVRADTPALWQALDDRNKGRFVRHLLSAWNTHRHRMAPEIHEKLAQDKNLTVMAGRIIDAAEDGAIAVRPRGDEGAWRFNAAKIINCAGTSFRTLIADNPLLAGLQRQGLIQPGPLGFGMATPQTPGLFALGTPLTGERLETVAVPELRQQAADAADAIVKMISYQAGSGISERG